MKIDGTPSTPKKSGKHRIGIREQEGRVVGRDKAVVPPEEVTKLASIGCKDSEIADWFGINSNTLRFNFSAELIKGRTNMKITLRRAMLDNAISSNNTVMQIFLSKNFLGMADSPVDTEENAPLPWIEGVDEDQIPAVSESEFDDLKSDEI